jgi:uncharacterized protein YndB with AHSA1/START domain
MITTSSVEIDAPAALVWEVFTDVERWPEWTESVTRLTALDGRDLATGRRFRIDQPRLPRLVWEVSEVSPGASWTWVQRSPGSTTVARHRVTAIADGRTLVCQEIEQRGIVGAVVGLLMRSTTKRYLELEGRGLKGQAERLRQADGPAS